MESFWQLNFGNILTAIVVGIGGIGFLYTMRGRVDLLAERMESVEEQLKKMVEVLIVQGRQDERIRLLNERQIAQGRRLDEAERRMNRIFEGKMSALARPVAPDNGENGN